MEAVTDNRNRTAADIRAAFNKYGGNLGETGCVGWMFEQWGVIVMVAPEDEEPFLEILLAGEAAGYNPIEHDQAGVPVVAVKVHPPGLALLSEKLEGAGYSIISSELQWLPLNQVQVNDSGQARLLLRLLDALEDLDDMQTIATNYS
jgi:transcriptional/translational regulatory protein YebC/TACO1